MPEKKPPLYTWAVSFAGEAAGFPVEAAYPVLEDGGHMVLKDSDHKVVFAAGPRTKCTFTRTGPVIPEAAPAEPWAFPDGCTCTYSAWTGTGGRAGGWERKINWGCTADHTEFERRTALVDGSVLADCCPHRIPVTVRCHDCSPVITPGTQAAEDARFAAPGVVSSSEIREMRYGLDGGDGGDAAGVCP